MALLFDSAARILREAKESSLRLFAVIRQPGGMGFTQSEWDPCFYYRDLPDGSRMFMVIYVDDAYVVDNGSAHADALLGRFHNKWTITRRSASFFLGNNITVE